jgi:hypothetical protein
MKMNVKKYLWSQLVLLSLCPILLHAQSSDGAQNLADCKNRDGTCDRSKLSQSELADDGPGFHSPDAEMRRFCIIFSVRTKGVYEYGYKIYPTP